MHPFRILTTALFLALIIAAYGCGKLQAHTPTVQPTEHGSSLEDRGYIRRFKDPTVPVTCWVVDGNYRTTAISCLPNGFLETWDGKE
jgi:hypothetical protein